MKPLQELLRDLRAALKHQTGAELLDAVREQNVEEAWWAFGRDPMGQHCLYIAMPLSPSQVEGLRTERVLLGDRAYQDAVKGLFPHDRGRLS